MSYNLFKNRGDINMTLVFLIVAFFALKYLFKFASWLLGVVFLLFFIAMAIKLIWLIIPIGILALMIHNSSN